MKLRILRLCIFVAMATAIHAEDFLDSLDETLTFSVLNDRAQVRLSGALDIEYYYVDEPPFGLVNSTANNLFNPRLSLFLDAQFGPKIYFFAQARVDRGFDPASDDVRMRLDEYAVRFTPWEDGRLSIQLGKFSPIIGNWMARHLSWDNPFITAPLPYEHITKISEIEVPTSAAEFTHDFGADTAYEYNPVIWSADYATGVSVSGRLGRFEYAAEMKNSALSARPESWDATEIGFDHPTFSARIGWRPTIAWNLGVSASRGPYMRPEVEPLLPRGRGIGDYMQTVFGQDISFAKGHFQIWAELYEARFEVPNVGNADTLAYYIETKYKFTPEFFAALRWNHQLFDNVSDGLGGKIAWGHDLWRADAAIGYRFTPHTQLKLQYSMESEDGPRGQSHAFGAQFTVRF